jgi:hypothetical protein
MFHATTGESTAATVGWSASGGVDVDAELAKFNATFGINGSKTITTDIGYAQDIAELPGKGMYVQLAIQYGVIWYRRFWDPEGCNQPLSFLPFMNDIYYVEFPIAEMFDVTYVDDVAYTTPLPPGALSPPSSQPQPVTSVVGLADGTVLATSDTQRIYKMVGGAPIWQATCDDNICTPASRPTTQAVINAGPPVPADSATLVDQQGDVFKFVGGAPIHLSTCSVGCGSPVLVSTWSVAALEHMRQHPADGATAIDEGGDVFKFVGGAPIHLSTCDGVGCGNPVPISTWSIATLEHMLPYPQDGSTVIDQQGDVFKFVGGAPIHLSSCVMGCGSPIPISTWSIANYDHMNYVPADNATLKTETTAVYKFAGGYPFKLSSDCSAGCGNPIGVTQWSVDTREHMRHAPADGASIVTTEDATLYSTAGGEVDLAGSCTNGCDNSIVLNQSSILPLVQATANRGPGYGELARYNNGQDHFSTVASVPAGYRFETPLGLLDRQADPGTTPLFACQAGTDMFTSIDPACEGQQMVVSLGWIYTASPQTQPLVALYRCKTAAAGEHFDSLDPNCEGRVVESRLGYTIAYSTLSRYTNGPDHATSTFGLAPGYQPEATFGMLSMVAQAGTQRLMSCMAGSDEFTSLDAACEGQQVVAQLGWIWAVAPQNLPSLAIYRCKVNGSGEHFDSVDAACEGQQIEAKLGYILARSILTRTNRNGDHRSSSGALPPGYRMEGLFGYLSMSGESGTQLLMACQSGTDEFDSLDPGCEGQEAIGVLGYIWQQPPAGLPSYATYRCKMTTTGEHFDSIDAGCEGQTKEGLLGYVRTSL